MYLCWNIYKWTLTIKWHLCVQWMLYFQQYPESDEDDDRPMPRKGWATPTYEEILEKKRREERSYRCVCVSMSVYLSVCLSVMLSISIYVYELVYVCLCVCVCMYLLICTGWKEIHLCALMKLHIQMKTILQVAWYVQKYFS